ncbi:MAG: hypothetical protein HDR43_01990 [Mycoplasma sp.]|nr:hypothetical protein [Mycoplasma sp.]
MSKKILIPSLIVGSAVAVTLLSVAIGTRSNFLNNNNVVDKAPTTGGNNNIDNVVASPSFPSNGDIVDNENKVPTIDGDNDSNNDIVEEIKPITPPSNGSEDESTNNGSNDISNIPSIYSIRKYSLPNKKAISSAKPIYDLDDAIDSIIDYIYDQQINSQYYNSSLKIEKAIKYNQGSLLMFNIDVKDKNINYLDAIIKIYFGDQYNWDNFHSFLFSNGLDDNIFNDISNFKIVYSATRNTNDYGAIELSPTKIVIVDGIDNEYEIELLTAKQNNDESNDFTSFVLHSIWNDKEIPGTIVDKVDGIPTTLNLVSNDFKASNFFNEDVDSIVDMTDKVKKEGKNFVFKNKEKFFINHEILTDVEQIENIVVEQNIFVGEINIKVTWKNIIQTTTIKLVVSHYNLLRYSYLQDIRNWTATTNVFEDIEIKYITSKQIMDIVLNFYRKSIGNYVDTNENKNQSITPDSFAFAISDNEFMTQLNPNSNLSNDKVLLNFSKVFGWNGKVWKGTISQFGTFPNIESIRNITNYFRFTIEETNYGNSSIKIRIIPTKVIVNFDNNNPDITWYYPEVLQNQKSFVVTYSIITGNQILDENLLGNIRTFGTASNEAVILDQNKTSMGSLTDLVAEYIYQRQYLDFGFYPRDTMFKAVNNSDTNNKLYALLDFKSYSYDYVNSLFKRYWMWGTYDLWKKTVIALGNKWIGNKIDYISTIQIEYEVEQVSYPINTFIKCKVKPTRVSISYSNGYSSDSWNFTGSFQEQKSFNVLMKKTAGPFQSNALPGTIIKI